jgi:hypothetical protein
MAPALAVLGGAGSACDRDGGRPRLRSGMMPCELGGTDSTAAIATAVLRQLQKA